MFGHKNKGPAGFIQIFRPGEAPEELETLRCVHCGLHWVRVPGSGRKRGFCMRCNGVTCGAEACDPCVPYEARIELMEGAKKGQPARKYAEEFQKIEGPERC